LQHGWLLKLDAKDSIVNMTNGTDIVNGAPIGLHSWKMFNRLSISALLSYLMRNTGNIPSLFVAPIVQCD
jgi:hypothetical protein